MTKYLIIAATCRTCSNYFENSTLFDVCHSSAVSRSHLWVEIKNALTTAPVLAHARHDLTFVVSTDASKYAVGATIEQEGHPIAYLSHRLSNRECKWDTGDQELLAFMIALREWDVYLRGRHFIFRTDHEPIRYLQTKARLSGRQARWLDEIQSYDFDVEHVPGKDNNVPDALSRRPDHGPTMKGMKLITDDFLEKVSEAYKSDVWSLSLIKALNDKDVEPDLAVAKQLNNYAYDGKIIHWIGSNESRVYVPNNEVLRDHIISMFHNVSHFGMDKTYNSISRNVYRRKMYGDVSNYVSSCHECQTNKVPNMLPAGELQPYDVPQNCWDFITADFVTEFPESRSGNDAVLVVVDKLSKRAIFIPLKKTAKAPEVANLFQERVFSKHGVPICMVSDRDPKFTSHFWSCLMELTNIRRNLSTADHPQTDGQSENMIRTLSNMLRMVVQRSPNEWDIALPELEFEYNSSKNVSTGLSPFEVDLGRLPMNPMTRKLMECKVKCQAAADIVERREAYRRIARDNLARARTQQKIYADKKRRHQFFKVDDLVMLTTKSLDCFKRSDLPAKWRPKFLGPLRILKVMGPVTYKIELPPAMPRAHNVFHVSRLKKYNKPLIDPGPLSIVVDADGNVEQEVAAILDRKRENRKLYYLVLFDGEPESEAVWLPKTDLGNCKDLVRQYEKSTRTSPSKRG